MPESGTSQLTTAQKETTLQFGPLQYAITEKKIIKFWPEQYAIMEKENILQLEQVNLLQRRKKLHFKLDQCSMP